MFSFSHKTFTNFSTTPNNLSDSFSAIKQSFTTNHMDKLSMDTKNSYSSLSLDKEMLDNNIQSVEIQTTENSSNSVTISNNDSQIEIKSPSSVEINLVGSKEVQESDTAFYTITMDMAIDKDLTFTVETTHITTEDEDYDPLYQTVTIKAGETSVDFTVQTLDDTITEGKEDYLVTMSMGPYDGDYNLTVQDDTAITTIIDDLDIGATLSLSGDTSTQEGQDATYTLCLDNQALQTMDIQVKVSNITTNGDIIEEIISLSIEKGQTQVSFNISNMDDDIYEDTEEYKVEIISNTNAGYEDLVLQNSEIITAILDDDGVQNNAPIANDDVDTCTTCSTELVNDNFDNNQGWGLNVFNGKLVLWAMDNSASKTFNFGIENAGSTVLISIDAKSAGLANPLHNEESTFKMNGTEFTLIKGEEAQTLSVEAIVDANGNVEVEFARYFCDGIVQDIVLDNLNITAVGNDWECVPIVLVDGFNSNDCPPLINNHLTHGIGNNALNSNIFDKDGSICAVTALPKGRVDAILPDVTLSSLNSSDSTSFDLGEDNAGKTVTVSFNAMSLSAGGLLNLSEETFYINGQEMHITQSCDTQTFTLDLLVDAQGKVDIEFSRPKSTIDLHLGKFNLENPFHSSPHGVDVDLNHICELIIINDFKILGSLDEWGCSTITTDENTPLLIAVLNNDIDPDNDAITITHIQGQQANNGEIIDIMNAGILVGSAKIVGEAIEFTPGEALKALDDKEFQEVIFEYTITDEHGATDSANVTLEVTGISDESSSELPGGCFDLSHTELVLDLSNSVVETTQNTIEEVGMIKEEIALSLDDVFDISQTNFLQTETQNSSQSNSNIFSDFSDTASDFSIGNIELVVDENAHNNWC